MPPLQGDPACLPDQIVHGNFLSPQWLKNKLLSIGLNPINNVVDITNFVLHETGQPLHVFDAAKIKGNKILVQTLKKGTIFKTLDEVDRKLDTNDLMICDGEDNGMCIAGVFGGVDSGIDTNSNDLFLESAYFSPDYIRKTAQAHGLKTDASFRFERGTDPNLTVYALKRASLLIKEIAGGEIASELIDIYPSAIENFKIDILFNHIDRLIGKSLPKEKIFEILKLLDIEVLQKSTEGFSVSVPPYRADVTREADIIEEILRIYGFNNIELPKNVGASSLAEFPQIDPDKIRLKVSEYLVDNGFYEVWNNSLTKPGYLNILGSDSSKKVEILNKLSEDLGVMRQSLLFSGLENISYNINRKQENLKLFEFGKIYFKNDSGYSELQKMSLFLTGNKKKENWHEPSRQVDIYDLIKIIKGLAIKISDPEITFSEVDKNEYTFSVAINYHENIIGTAGKIKPGICSQFGIEKEIFYAELDWDLLLQNANDNIVLEEVSKYPEVRRDLSLVLDKQVSFEEIRALTQQLENRLIKEINVFDVYEGENLGTHKKAYALSFILQDNEKTLTDKIIDKTMNRLMKNFEEKLGAIIRK